MGLRSFHESSIRVFYLLSILSVLGYTYCIRRGYLWAKLLKIGLFLFLVFRIASNIRAMSILSIHGFWEGVTAISQFVLSTAAAVFIVISLKIQIQAAKQAVE